LAAPIGGLGVAWDDPDRPAHGNQRRTRLTTTAQRWNGDYGAKLIKMELD